MTHQDLPSWEFMVRLPCEVRFITASLFFHSEDVEKLGGFSYPVKTDTTALESNLMIFVQVENAYILCSRKSIALEQCAFPSLSGSCPAFYKNEIECKIYELGFDVKCVYYELRLKSSMKTLLKFLKKNSYT